MIAKYRWLLICVLSLVIVLILFYAFFWRHVSAYDSQLLYPHGMIAPQLQVNFLENNVLPLLELPVDKHPKVIVFHWIDIDCKCTLLGKPFIEKLTTKGKPELVSHVVLTKPKQQVNTERWLKLAKNVQVIALKADIYQQSLQYIPSSPGASIYYRDGQSLSYFGPHSSGVTCGQGSNYIELVLNNLSYGFDPKLTALQSEGCFCPW